MPASLASLLMTDGHHTGFGLRHKLYWEEWNAATSVAKALKIGKFESEATFNLQTKVAKSVVDKMKDAVAKRGLGKLVTHELLAKDILNQNFSSGLGQAAAWQEECRNLPDNRLATW